MKPDRIFIIIFILISISCNNRRNPNLSIGQLQSLPDSIFVKQESAPEFKPVMPEGYIPQAGVKYRQVRDLSTPPVRIDILKGINDVRNIKLSQIASDIEYVNIGKHRFSVVTQVTPHGILVSNDDGVWLYSFEGKLIREIYKNICDFEPWGDYGVSARRSDRHIGVTQVRYNEKEDRIWLQYVNGSNPMHLGYIDMAGKINVSGSEQNQDSVTLLGAFRSGSVAYGGNFIIHTPYVNNIMPTSYSFNGDTLCRFVVGYDTITSNKLRGISVDFGTRYDYRGVYTFRRGFSDTLFRITAANVLKPEYVIDVGTSGRATNTGKPSDVDLEQMYIIQSVREDDEYLYIKFSKDYASQYNIEKNKVRFWWGLYDKAKYEFFTLPFNDDNNPYEGGFENDIDGGMPLWPVIMGEYGEKLTHIIGKDMKKKVTPDMLKDSNVISAEKKEKLRKFMQTLKDDDRVIIIVR